LLRPVPGGGPGGPACGLVVAVGVEGELADEFAGGGVVDAVLEVVEEHEDAGWGVGSADAGVVELAVVAEGELAVGVGAVGADPVVAGGAGLARDGLRPGVAGDSRGLAVRQGPVRAAGGVVAGEGVQPGLELGDGDGPGLGCQPFRP